ncbi:MAG: DUF4430 domain-containing protein [Lachnospiraceae bacterium]|nr:DUF4430 domain-containing protein [Lachnospiraceae bacterium]
MTEKQRSTKPMAKWLPYIVGALFGALLVGLFFVYQNFKEKPVVGEKDIVIEVTSMSGEVTKYELNTDAQFLIEAMEEAKSQGLTFSGTTSEYGLSIEVVNGEKAVYSEGAYWSFYVNGEYCNYGVETQPVEDEDQFSIVFTDASTFGQ